jgi:hypothetical protein
MTSVPFQLEFPWSTLRSTANEGCATIKRSPHKIATWNHQKTAQKALFSLFFRLFYPITIFLSILATQRYGRQFLFTATTISGWKWREPLCFQGKNEASFPLPCFPTFVRIPRWNRIQHHVTDFDPRSLHWLFESIV